MTQPEALVGLVLSASRYLGRLPPRGGGDSCSGAFRASTLKVRHALPRVRQIGSEGLITPNTCPGQPIGRSLARSERGSSVL